MVNAARLAAEEASAHGDGRPVDVVLIDAGRPATDVLRDVSALVPSGLVDALVGCHTSDIRAAVMHSNVRIPYIFTPPREFSTRSEPEQMTLGPAPDAQLSAPIQWLSNRFHLSRWAMIGSDYIWPRHVHHAVGRLSSHLHLQPVAEQVVPFGDVDAERIVGRAQRAGAEGLIVSLIGRDAVRFHRDFRQMPCASSMLRLCTSFDEDSLLAIGGDETELLFAAMPTFSTDEDERQQRLQAAYDTRFASPAPSLGPYATSVYDGVHLAAELQMRSDALHEPPGLIAHRLCHGTSWSSAPLGRPTPTIRLAQAQGTALQVVARFPLPDRQKLP